MTLYHEVQGLPWYTADGPRGFVSWFHSNTGVGWDASFIAGHGDEATAVVYDAEGDELCVCKSVEDAVALAVILNKAAEEKWWP